MKIGTKWRRQCASLLAVVLLLSGCTAAVQKQETDGGKDGTDTGKQAALQYEVDPETFYVAAGRGEKEAFLPVSLAGEKREVENFVKDGEETTWEYPKEQIAVSMKPIEDYLQVTISSLAAEDHSFSWPEVSGEEYLMPFGEGKRVPAEDATWASYLSGEKFEVMEQLSMPFWAAASGEEAVLYIMENPYRTKMAFSETSPVAFHMEQEFATIDPDKEVGYRIYILENDPVAAAKTYRQYVAEQGDFVTLEQKAEQNPNIRKLYGAPQIYLWGERLILPEDILWPAFRKLAAEGGLQYLESIASELEDGQEALSALEAIKEQDYVDQYQKNIICRFLSLALQQEDFYDPEAFPAEDEEMGALLEKGIAELTEPERLSLHMHALAANMPGVFQPVESWMESETVGFIQEIRESGIERAWIGLNSWEQAYAKPALVEEAAEAGYLIGPYDSYHSIHAPGEEKWITAKFPDTTLYEQATIVNQAGEKEKGFQQVGRKLNPTLSMPSVKQRTGEIMETGIPFNSWFIDCDATGEIYDDYSPAHVTTRQQDLQARLERMAYIRDEYSMVIGSEGGNDFAASTIAFAHGIELKSFSWMDEDMKSNKDSEYYIGKYYSPTGGVAEHFAKRIPLKAEYTTLFVNPMYDIPLFKLVYQDSVITSYHWDWSTFKIIGAVQDRMLREILYNVPPLYHLDRTEWEEYKEDLVAHTKVWSEFSRQAVLEEMTDFQYLEKDGSVQMTRYGDSILVVANFSDNGYSYENTEIPPHSLLLKMGEEQSMYTPKLADGHQ